MSAIHYYRNRRPRSFPKNRMQGLTLIEVLIALAIVGIALTAIIKATTQNIQATSYLQTKTIAMWVGEEVLNEARLNLLKLPDAPDKRKKTTTMLDQHWYWQASQEATPNPRIFKVEVDVFTHENANGNESPIVHLESYIYHE